MRNGRKFFFILLIVCLFIVIFSQKVMTYYEPTDIILDEVDDAIYMIRCLYLDLTTGSSERNCGNIIYKINFEDNSKEIFYESFKLAELTLSPDYKYLSAIKGYGSYIKTNDIIIIDRKEKKEIVSFKDDIRIYKWSPDSRKIVYITGEDDERSGLIPSGVWVYDIEKKEKKKIAEKALDVEWLHNDYIYLIYYYADYSEQGKGKTICSSSIYNYKNSTIEKREINGVKFSLDGRYSIALGSEYIGFLPGTIEEEEKIRINFIDLEAEQQIPQEKLSNVFSEPSNILWESIFWVKGNRVVIKKSMPGERVRYNTICDIENNKILKTVKGEIVGVNNDRSKIVIYHNNKFEVIDVP